MLRAEKLMAIRNQWRERESKRCKVTRISSAFCVWLFTLIGFNIEAGKRRHPILRNETEMQKRWALCNSSLQIEVLQPLAMIKWDHDSKSIRCHFSTNRLLATISNIYAIKWLVKISFALMLEKKCCNVNQFAFSQHHELRNRSARMFRKLKVTHNCRKQKLSSKLTIVCI